jgi:hypothetical protein
MSKELKAFIEKISPLSEKYTQADLARELGIPRTTLIGKIDQAVRQGIAAPKFKKEGATPQLDRLKADPEGVIKKDREVEALKAKIGYWKTRAGLLEDESDKLREQVVLLSGMDEVEISPKPIIKSRTGEEAAACLVLSDLHLAERVLPGDVAGLDVKFNPDIASRRLRTCVSNGLDLAKFCGKRVHMHEMVVAILGDMMNGFCQPDGVESNTMSPLQEVQWLSDHLVDTINFLLKNSDYRFTIVCTMGNHARNTPKKRSTTLAETSFEFLLYSWLSKYFISNDRVHFVIAQSDIVLQPIFGRQIRFTHGDCIKFNGGLGGISVPLNKAIYRWDAISKADLTVLGHYHSLNFGPGFVVNGSIVGQNSYGQSLGLAERPLQAFFTYSKEHGRTICSPVEVE